MLGEGRGPGCPVPAGDTVRGPPPQPLSLPRRFLCRRGVSSADPQGWVRARGARVQVRDRDRVRVSTGVTARCRSTVPHPTHCPLATVPSPLTPRLGTCIIPRPPTALGTVPSDSTQQGTVQPLQPSPGPGVPRAGDSGTHLAGGRGGRQGQGAAAPTRGWPGRPGWRSAAVGSGGRAGAALRKFGRGKTTEKGKK